MTAPLALDAAHARRFFVRRHLLAPARSLPGTAASVMHVVERFGSLQFDPLDVPGAKNHDLVLHARIADYRPSILDALLYGGTGDDRRLFEAYNKSLNILPVDELPWHRLGWGGADTPRSNEILEGHARTAKAILERLAREGPLSPAVFDRTEKIESDWGTTTTLSRRVLEALFVTGHVGIHRREGGRRFYDRLERLFSPEILARRVDDEEAHLHRLLTRHRAVGLMGEGGSGELVIRTGKLADRKRRVHALIDRGALMPVEIEGVKGVRHVLASELPLLEASRAGAKGKEKARERPTVAFLAPLDPFLWDRRLVRELFDFEYTWEVYTPVAKRAYGYYVLPMLFGDRLIGRIEPRFEKKAKRLHVAAAWLEDGFALETPGFRRAFGEAMRGYAAFVGAERVTFGRGKVVRELGKMLR